MNTLLVNYIDLLNKPENINKIMEELKEEILIYEEKYLSTLFIFKKLHDKKSEILKDEPENYHQQHSSEKGINNNHHLYSIPEINNEDNINNMSDTTKDFKKDIQTSSKSQQINEINHKIHNSILDINKDNEDEKINIVKELKSLKKQFSSNNNEDNKY